MARTKLPRVQLAVHIKVKKRKQPLNYGDCVSFPIGDRFGGFIVIRAEDRGGCPYQIRCLDHLSENILDINSFKQRKWRHALRCVLPHDVYRYWHSGELPFQRFTKFCEQILAKKSANGFMERAVLVDNIASDFIAGQTNIYGIPCGDFILDYQISKWIYVESRSDFLRTPELTKDGTWKYLVNCSYLSFDEIIEHRLPKKIITEAEEIQRRMALMPVLPEPTSMEEVKSQNATIAKAIRRLRKDGKL